MTWIVGLLQILFGLFGKNKSERLGRAERELEIRKTDDERLSKASEAAAAVARRIEREPDSLRDPDPYSRD